jgi:hypothetical protein
MLQLAPDPARRLAPAFVERAVEIVDSVLIPARFCMAEHCQNRHSTGSIA